MTENEIINRLHLHGKTMTQDEAFFIMDALEEIQQYREIGTVEEFKTLEENERKCEDCGGCTAWKCDCANVRAKAIDEFAKAEDYLMDKIKEEKVDVNIDYEWRKVVCLDDIRRMLHQGLCEIAEQLKGARELYV